MRFRILGSSSAGNCALICTPGGKVLIDAGFSGKRIEALLELAETSLHEIQAIFLTHEHGDHTAGVRGLTRKHPELRLFANRDTARAVQDKIERRLNWQVFETGIPFAFNDLEVSPFAIPHDAYDPVGYVFRCGGRDENGAAMPMRSLCWLTDLGYVPPAARRHARECDLLVVEANHDPEMLENCQTRSWSTKQRIRGRHGHLSNQAAYDLLAAECEATEPPAWKHICLAHISGECNTLDIVHRQFEPLRNGSHKLDIHIFDPASPTPGAEFDLWQDCREACAAETTEAAQAGMAMRTAQAQTAADTISITSSTTNNSTTNGGTAAVASANSANNSNSNRPAATSAARTEQATHTRPTPLFLFSEAELSQL